MWWIWARPDTRGKRRNKRWWCGWEGEKGDAMPLEGWLDGWPDVDPSACRDTPDVQSVGRGDGHGDGHVRLL